LNGFDLPLVAAFVRGYRSRIALSDAELADAARRRWWNLICSTWPLHRDDSSCDRGV
jgi:hypothetical protein